MKVTLKLHKELYAIPLIHKAINAYRGLAHITVKEKGEHFICSFSRCKYDATTTKQEFANYLIDLSNSKESL